MIICIQIRFRTGATTTVALHQISRWNGLDLGDTIAPWFSPPRRFLQLQQMMAMLDTSHYPFRSLEKNLVQRCVFLLNGIHVNWF